MNRIKLITPILAIALLTACAATGIGQPGETPQPAEPTPTEEPMPDNGGMAGEVPDEIVSRIISDAMDQAGVAEDEIEVLRAEAVTWNDGSLGCPEPGMMYTQALVEGYHILLRASDDELDYRVGQGGHFILCDNPQDEGMPSS